MSGSSPDFRGMYKIHMMDDVSGSMSLMSTTASTCECIAKMIHPLATLQHIGV